MSIWCSWREIGWDKWRKKPRFVHGEVRSYASGFSNHYPTSDGEYEQPADIGISSIPVWCVAGHRDEDGDEIGPWLRLDIGTWDHDSGRPRVPVQAAVVMDEKAVRSLVKDMRAWLKAPKAYPVADLVGDREDRNG